MDDTTQQQVTPNQPPQERSFYGKHKWLKWGLIYLAIAAIVYGGIYYFVLSKQGLNPYSVAPTSAPQPPATPTDIEATRSANWKTYALKTLKLEFKLPPMLGRFGELEEKIIKEKFFEGNTLCISLKNLLIDKPFCDFNYFGFSTISSNYNVGRGVGFGDFQGFTYKDGKYYGKVLKKNFELPSDVLRPVANPNRIEIIEVIGRVDPEGDDFPTPGEGWIGALVNTSHEMYPGITVSMELKDGLTEEVFNQILSTFKFLDQTSATPTMDPYQVACTHDLKLCPDGSYVGRQPPKCEFAPCP